MEENDGRVMERDGERHIGGQMHYSFSNKERYNPERLRQIHTVGRLALAQLPFGARTLLQRQGALQLSVVDGLHLLRVASVEF